MRPQPQVWLEAKAPTPPLVSDEVGKSCHGEWVQPVQLFKKWTTHIFLRIAAHFIEYPNVFLGRREFRLGGTGGFKIGEPLREFHGVLTGVPQFKGESSTLLKTAKAAR